MISDQAQDSWLDALAGTGSARQRVALYEKHPALIRAITVAELHTEVVRRVLVDVEQAGRLARAAGEIAARLRDPESRALSLRAAGHVCYSRSDYERALACYDRAARAFERAGNRHELGRTLSSGLQTLIYLGRYEQALGWAARAREIFKRQGDELRLARLDSNLGNLFYRQDRYQEALELYRRAHERFRLLGEPRDVAAVLSNMAVCHISVHEFETALSLYEEVRTFCRENAMPVLVAEADYNIAYLHFIRGEYMTAIDLYESAREYCREAGDRYHAALCDLDQAELYLELNLSREGAELAEQARRAFAQLEVGYEQAKALAFLAVAEHHRGAPGKALRLFGQARRLFRNEGNAIWPALIDIYRALVWFESGRPEAARIHAGRALRFFEPTALVNRTATCELLLARYQLLAGRSDDARRYCRNALARLAGADQLSVRFQAELLLGQTEEQSGDRDSALEAYQRAWECVESLRSTLLGEDLKISFFKNKLAVYEALVRLHCEGPVQGEDAAPAFIWIEQAKSRTLSDLLTLDPSLDGRLGLASSPRELRRELNACRRRLEDAGSRDGSSLAFRMQELWRQARAGEAGQSYSIALDDIQARIPQGALILEYFQAGDRLVACIVGRETLRIRPVADASQVLQNLRLLRFQIAKSSLPAGPVRTFSDAEQAATDAHLRDLYLDLVAPVREDLSAEHLIIVPHGSLHWLPFHALLDGRRSLTDDFTISYAPSAAVFRLCSTRAGRHDGTSLVLGVPDESAPLIEAEARFAAACLPNSTLLLGTAATESALNSLGRSSRFIHIATHGTFRSDNPMFSSLRLGDSNLTVLALHKLDLAAELVILSGCSTGLNLVAAGDELIGLVRGILCAGASAVLVSLWDVGDQTAAEFMVSFYRHLSCYPNKAKALQSAMRELREAHAHPCHWAPFILTGSHIEGQC